MKLFVQKTIFIFALVTLLGTAATLTAAFPHSQLASADPDRKFKSWVTEDGQFGASTGCDKADGGCKQYKEAFGGDNVNKVAKESCESGSGQKCKQQPKK